MVQLRTHATYDRDDGRPDDIVDDRALRAADGVFRSPDTARHVAARRDRAGHLLVAIATMSATLTVKVLRGEGLRAADSNGSSDPYAVLHVGDAKPWRSQTRHRDLNPVWNGSAIFERVPLQRTPLRDGRGLGRRFGDGRRSTRQGDAANPRSCCSRVPTASNAKCRSAGVQQSSRRAARSGCT